MRDYELNPSSKPRTDFHAILRNNFPELDRDTIDQMSWDEARGYYWSNKPKPKPKDLRDSVCFTGFTAGEKQELSVIAERLNLRIAKSVVKNLTYLVFGPNAGPKKLEKATAQGVAIISEADFKKLETG